MKGVIEESYKKDKYSSAFLTTSLCLYLIISVLIWISGVGPRNGHLVAIFVPISAFITSLIANRNLIVRINKLAKNIHRFCKQVNPIYYIIFISLLFFIVWTASFFHAYSTFSLPTWDAGIYGNIVFNSSIGKFFYSSVLEKNHLGEHFSPIMIIFIPFYWIKSDIRWILLVQSLTYCCLPILLYRLTKIYTKDINVRFFVSILLGISWFLYLPMRSATDFTFHPSSLTAPIILMAFIFMEEEKYIKMLITLGGLILFKENTMFVSIGFGLYLIFKHKKIKLGLALVLIGSITMLFLIKLVIPFFSMNGYSKLERFGFFQDIGLKLKYIIHLLLPLFFLPIIFWRYGVIFLPALFQNIIVSFQPMYSSQYHYDDLTSPLLFACMPGIIILELLPFLRKLSFTYFKFTLVPIFALLLCFSKPSPLMSLALNPITNLHIELDKELKILTSKFKNEKIYLQSPLFTHINHSPSQDFKFCDERIKFKKGTLIAIAPSASLSHFNIKNLDQCFYSLKSDKNLLEVKGFKNLSVFQLKKDY
tara:strand:- start:868 stop:2472 length:1605 start_codon:yes stop_codon:yes gene_type:complete